MLNEQRINIFSYGGGTQTICMAAMIMNGDLPKPDLAVIVDTERETDEVWQYMNHYVVPGLSSVGVELHRARKSDYTKHDLNFETKKESVSTPLMPMFLNSGGGAIKGLLFI